MVSIDISPPDIEINDEWDLRDVDIMRLLLFYAEGQWLNFRKFYYIKAKLNCCKKTLGFYFVVLASIRNILSLSVCPKLFIFCFFFFLYNFLQRKLNYWIFLKKVEATWRTVEDLKRTLLYLRYRENVWWNSLLISFSLSLHRLCFQCKFFWCKQGWSEKKKEDWGNPPG